MPLVCQWSVSVHGLRPWYLESALQTATFDHIGSYNQLIRQWQAEFDDEGGIMECKLFWKPLANLMVQSLWPVLGVIAVKKRMRTRMIGWMPSKAVLRRFINSKTGTTNAQPVSAPARSYVDQKGEAGVPG